MTGMLFCCAFSRENIKCDSHLVPIIQFCPGNATWKKQGVTVAGFSNGTSSSSLAGLLISTDLQVDAVGNLLIADFGNHRILYWPKNSVQGHIIAGTGNRGGMNNQLNGPITFRGNDKHCPFYTLSKLGKRGRDPLDF